MLIISHKTPTTLFPAKEELEYASLLLYYDLGNADQAFLLLSLLLSLVSDAWQMLYNCLPNEYTGVWLHECSDYTLS
jgi:hypothetical protein